jgi:heat shock protein HtpX
MSLGTIGLSTYRWNNNLRSIVILALYPLILIGIIWLMAYASGFFIYPLPYGMKPDLYLRSMIPIANSFIFQYWPFITGFVLMWFAISGIFHTQMMRSLARSHPVSRTEEPELYALLENLCISRGLPMPQFDIIETHARNAFASGISEKTYRITVTRGLLTALEKDELEGVLAHELTHIINQDVRLLVVTVIFAGLFGFLCQLAWTLFRGSLRIRAGGRRSNGQGQLAIILASLVFALILSVGYFATLWSRFALSRRREYDADAGAVELTKNPEAMMRALMRISGREHIPNGRADVMLMCIENTKPFMGLFATHPPIERRIAALSAVTNTPIPAFNPALPAQAEERLVPHPDPTPVMNTSRRPNPWVR